MPFTLAAWSESQDLAGAFGPVAAVSDQHLRTSGDSIYVPAYKTLIGAAAYAGTVGSLARLVAPSLRRFNPFYIEPPELVLVPSNPAKVALQPGIAIELDEGEQLQAELNSNPAAAEQETVLAFLASGAIQPVSGRILTVRFNITLTQVAGGWTFSPIDFIDELPTGNYQVVGGAVRAAGAVAFRLSFVGQWHRPGGPAAQVANQGGLGFFRAGWLGVWGTFEQTNPPVVELLGSAAAGSTTYEGVLDLIPA